MRLSKINFKNTTLFAACLLILVGCGGGGGSSSGGGTPATAPPIATGALGNIVVGQAAGANAPIIAIATDKTSLEKIGITVDRTGGPANGTVSGIAYTTPNGVSVTMYTNATGLPAEIVSQDGSKIVFSNFTGSTVDISEFNAQGVLINGPIRQTINPADITAMQQAFANANPLAVGAIINNPNAAAWLKWGGLAVNWGLCAGLVGVTVASGGLTALLAAGACGSALLSTVSAFTNFPAVDAAALAVDAAGCTGLAVATLGVSCLPYLADTLLLDMTKPTSKIVTPSNGLNVDVNALVTYTASGNQNYTPPVSTFTWQAGDGTQAQGSPVSHRYQVPGNYTVTLTTVYQNGKSAIDTVQITVNQPAAPAPALLSPQPVVNPTAIAGNSSVIISWSPSLVTGNNTPTSYNIYWSTVPGVTTASNKLTGVTSPYTHTALTNGATYYYIIEAANLAGVSTSSPELAVQPTPAVVPPTVLRPLNDTGITQWGNAIVNNLTVTQPLFPAQDADVGRDAQAAAGTLVKTGGGRAGFDFTKIGANGVAIANQAALYVNTPWDCVQDNVTGLMWEVKTTAGLGGLRDSTYTYTWFNSTGTNDGGHPGTANGGTCIDAANCDTEKYVAAVNAAGLCGFADWRLPTREELRSIVDYGIPAPSLVIDTGYFPNIGPPVPIAIWLLATDNLYWSASPSYTWNVAWSIGLAEGYDKLDSRNSSAYVRLVRGFP